MRFGILGAGGIGSYYAGMLSRAGHSVTLLARGDHLRAIRERGLEVWYPEGAFIAQPAATDVLDDLLQVDYLLLAVRGFSLPDVVPFLGVAGRAGTTIVSLLNGVDVAEQLEAGGVPRECILPGLVATSVVRVAPGVVARTRTIERVVIGELDHTATPRATALVEALRDAGIPVEISHDIHRDLWRKFALIVPINVVCGLMRGPIGPVLAIEEGRALIKRTLAEIVELSAACGTPLSAADWMCQPTCAAA